MAKILLIEDDDETRHAVKSILELERHTLDCASSAEEGSDFIKTYLYDLFIFDWEMPGMSGVELLRKYRSGGGKTPVVMLTGRYTVPDKISGLDSGADNYLTKPFEADVLLSVVRSILRRTPVVETERILFAGLDLKPASSAVFCGDKSAELSNKELVVLTLLLENTERIVSHDELKACAWVDNPDVSSGAVRVFLSSLREKLTNIGSNIQIVSIKGYGYQLKQKS